MFKWFKRKEKTDKEAEKPEFKISYSPDHKCWFLYKRSDRHRDYYTTLEAAKTLEQAEEKLKIYVDGRNISKRFYDKNGNLI
jgi:hypothetical protein